MSDAKLPDGISGRCDERFGAVADVLASQIERDEHHGVAFAAYFRGEPVVDIWGGVRSTPEGDAPWQEDTMALCFSTTKGVAATALHMVMERSGTTYDTPIAQVWPEFGTEGKDVVTIRHALCHEAGVPQIRDQVDSVWDMSDWDAMVRMVSGLEPLWEPGTANGYHAINFAWLIGELIRRIDGRDVPTFLAEELAGPLGLDGLFIGTPPHEHHRVAPLVTPEEVQSSGADEQLETVLGKDSIVLRALSPRGNIVEFFNTPQGLGSCIPSASGVFTARSLAKLYAALERGGEVGGTKILTPETIATATTQQNDRNDLVIFLAPRWRLGYMTGGSAVPVLGPNDEAYGHVGAGGTYAGADPKAEVTFGLVYDRFAGMDLLGAARGALLASTVVRAAEAAL
jgi:CubicO group peptidase (beta-lactamase class C family)